MTHKSEGFPTVLDDEEERPTHVVATLVADPASGVPWRAIVVHRGFPGWAFTMQFSEDGTVESLHIDPENQASLMRPRHWPPRRPVGDTRRYDITARFLRSLPLGEIVQEARMILPRSAAAVRNPNMAEIAGRVAKRPGRAGRGDTDYAALAAEYVRLLDAGDVAPIASLSKSAYLSESQVRGLIHEARQRGLLTKPPSGRAGGVLTDKAIEVLKGAGDGEHG